MNPHTSKHDITFDSMHEELVRTWPKKARELQTRRWDARRQRRNSRMRML